MLYKWGTVWARAVKVCTDLLEMGCRDKLLPVNGLYMCGAGWTYVVEMGYCNDMCCKDYVQTGHGL